MSDNKFTALVLDSGAFIDHASIAGAAEEFYSVEEVMCEVRDKLARDALERFPYEIKIRHPSPEAINAVGRFAKATGDFSRLSQTDLLLIALTYDLQKEIAGPDSVNVVPLMDRSRIVDVHEKRIVGINVSSVHCKHFDTPAECPYGVDCFYRHAGDIDQEEYKQSKEKAKSETPKELSAPKPPREPRRWAPLKPVTPVRIGDDASFPALGAATVVDHSDLKAIFAIPKRPVVEVSKSGEQVDQDDRENETEKSDVESIESNEESKDEVNDVIHAEATETSPEETSNEVTSEPAPVPNPSQSRIHVASSLVGAPASAGTSEDAGDWISDATLSSFEQNLHGTALAPAKEESRRGNAALCTGDFAMQNVSLQMNLPLLSYANRRISQLRVHTRRCRDCFAVCDDDTKLFCPQCGHPSLARVPVFVKKGGIVRVGEAFQSRSLRGTIYSIGKNADLLLCEDQLKTGKWKQRLYEMKRASKEGCIFGDVGSESLGLETKKKDMSYINGLVIGYGRKNPNEMKGRVKRGKKKQKKQSRF